MGEAAKHKATGWITERTQISEDDRSKVMKMIEDIGKWMGEKEKKQENVETTDTPAFTSSDVKTQIRPLQRLMGRMLAKKVPEPVDPNKKNETTAETDAKDSDTTSKGEGEKEEGKKDDSSSGDRDGKKKGEKTRRYILWYHMQHCNKY